MSFPIFKFRHEQSIPTDAEGGNQFCQSIQTGHQFKVGNDVVTLSLQFNNI